MAVAAGELAGAAEGGEALSPEADSAVRAAAAGHGRRLTPEVASELRRRAARKGRDASGGVEVVHRTRIDASGAVHAATGTVQAVSSPRGRSNVLAKLILATILGLVALELASLASGRYFDWSFGKGAPAAAPPTPTPAANFAQQFQQKLGSVSA